MAVADGPVSAGQRLDSWKEISAYLKRDPRTLQRWEKKEGLPVHRHVHESQVSIYAYTSELDAWLAGRTVPPGALPQARRWYEQARFAGPSIAVLIAAVTGIFALARSAGSPPAVPQRAFRQAWTGKEADFWAAISPDGRYCSYSDAQTGNLWIHDLILGQNHQVTRWPKDTALALDAVFAPDGKTIAYTWWPRNKLPWEIHVIGLDGKNDRILFKDSGEHQLRLQDWSANGKWIAATISSLHAQQLALISPRDGALRVVKEGNSLEVQRAAFSRDSRYLAYDSPGGPGHGGDIFMVSTEGREDHAVIEYPSNEFLVGWGLKDDTLVFTSDRSGSTGVWKVSLSRGLARGEPELIKADLGRIIPVTVTRSGSIYTLLQTGLSDIYLAELGSKNPPSRLSQRLIGSKTYPSYSPDGSKLLYQTSFSTAGGRIVERVLASGEEREIHPQLKFFMKPRWTDQGSAIDVWGSDGTTIGTWRVDAASGAVKVLEAGPPKPLYKPPEGLRGPGDPTPSPDGSMILLGVRDSPKGYNSLRLVSPGGRLLREVVRIKQPDRFTGAFGWSPDSRVIYFTRVRGSEASQEAELFRIPAAGGRFESTGIRMNMIQFLSIHPDGRHIAFVSGGFPDNVELWALDGFLAR